MKQHIRALHELHSAVDSQGSVGRRAKVAPAAGCVDKPVIRGG